MSTKTNPAGKSALHGAELMRTVTPHLIVGGAAAAIDFYQRAFGAVEVMRLPDGKGIMMHARVRIGDSIVMLLDEFPEMGARGPKAVGATSVTIHLQVPDVDALFAQAVAAGATAIMPPADMFWGDRYAIVQDPFGHSWSLATHVRDVPIEELQRAAQSHGCG